MKNVYLNVKQIKSMQMVVKFQAHCTVFEEIWRQSGDGQEIIIKRVDTTKIQ